MADQQGAFTNYSGNLGYAYHLPLSKQLLLAYGFSGTFNSFQFDSNKSIVQSTANDLVYQLYQSGQLDNNTVYLNTGFTLYSSKLYLAYGINGVIVKGLGGGQVTGVEGIETQHNIITGANIEINDDFSVAPGLLFSYKELSPFALYASSRLYYRDTIWLGLNYRKDDAIGTSFGLLFDDKYKIAYSYDVPISKLDNNFGTSHEFVFGILLSKGAAPNPFVH